MALRSPLPALLLLALLAAAGPCASARGLLQQEANAGADGPPASPAPADAPVSVPLPELTARFAIRPPAILRTGGASAGDEGAAPSPPSRPGPPGSVGELLGRVVRDIIAGVAGEDSPQARQAGVGPLPVLGFGFKPELTLTPKLGLTALDLAPKGTLASNGLALTLANNLGLSSALQPQATLTAGGALTAPPITTTYKAPKTSVKVDGGESSKTVKAASGAGQAAGDAFANALAAAAGAQPAGASP
ncbi:hypothetical protein Rsub_09003 [Raphidocelis subcapitata]|uniref:Uncharacterized protein n=1 Tax=Raphidocelis subcapitata TaxID=307507 RepID=A0A2V0PG99_9CHLO|nr:hypothetical protein Rsub_09003 [Raphidocelis subcapitata]|eukprot:GBF96923.1 hypothetical protein Rsub_09003 [Raphidocelis subcapitata]